MTSTDSGQHTISRSTILYGSSKGDVWHDMEQFYTDHIREICYRISSLDDDIWGKIVLMEKNKRVAKAYLRIPVIVVDGSSAGFDGKKIGFCSFENPTRDRSVEEIRNKIGAFRLDQINYVNMSTDVNKYDVTTSRTSRPCMFTTELSLLVVLLVSWYPTPVLQGVVLKMDQKGNVLVKRTTASPPVIIQSVDRQDLCCFGSDVAKTERGRLAPGQAVKVFDMKLFKNSIEQELLKPYPNKKRLMFQTLLRISLVKEENSPLNTPSWITVINLVALDMLVTKVPTMPTNLPSNMFPVRGFPEDEDDLELNDHHHQQLLNQVSCDLYGTLTPMSSAPTVFTKNPLSGFPSPVHSSSNELLDQINRNREKLWKSNVVMTNGGGGYMSEAEGTKLQQLCRRGRSLDTRQQMSRPVSQCWSTAPSVENLHNLYASIDNVNGSSSLSSMSSNGRNNFNSHSLKIVGNNVVNGKKHFGNVGQNAVTTYYGNVKNNNSNWSCAGSTSDYESGRIEIYESSNSSSNSGVSMLSGSCRASSPSIVSEASESQTSDSGFADNEIAGSVQTLSSTFTDVSVSEKGSKKKSVKNSSTTANNLDSKLIRSNRRLSQTSAIINNAKPVIETVKIETTEHNRGCDVKEQSQNSGQWETKPEVAPAKRYQLQEQNTQNIVHPVPPARKRHQCHTAGNNCHSPSVSCKQMERTYLPLSLAPVVNNNINSINSEPVNSENDDDDDSESTKIWSF